jgi:SAM-dependent methyltransferase
MAGKRYDRAYFDRWYRSEGFGSRVRLDRKVAYALGAAEYLLDRPVRRVLDVGCGEGQWSVALRGQRPGIHYVGIDPSAYAVERYGRRRGVRLGGIADLGHDDFDIGGAFDLVICCDVLPYVPAAEVRRGLAGMARRLAGVAFVEIWTSSDGVEGDLEQFHRRTARTYERWLCDAGLVRLGPHLYTTPASAGGLAAFERPLTSR